jgi:hypothetical protein
LSVQKILLVIASLGYIISSAVIDSCNCLKSCTGKSPGLARLKGLFLPKP